MTMLATIVLGSIVASLVCLAVMTAAAVLFALRRGGRREDPADNHEALSASRFTIPVSIVVPISDGRGPAEAGRHEPAPSMTAIDATIEGLAALNYPELEIIVVAESLPADTWTALKAAWGLDAKELFYRQSLTTGAVRMIYRSAREPRLLIVDKTPGPSRADAVNCGVNLARFRYVSTVPIGITFDADALLRAMAAPMRDPAAVAGASCHIEIASGPGIRDSEFGIRPLLQSLASIRSLMRSRMAASRGPQAAPAAHDAVMVWRRDALIQLGGFSTAAADPDFDMAMRLKASPAIAGEVVRTAEIFGHMPPRSVAATLHLTARRQRAALQAMRSLMGSGVASRRGLVYLLATELLTPALQAWVVAGTLAAAASGWATWRDVALAVVLLSFSRAIVSGSALLLRGSAPAAPDGNALTRLLLVAPLEVAVSGSVSLVGRTAGLLTFVSRG